MKWRTNEERARVFYGNAVIELPGGSTNRGKRQSSGFDSRFVDGFHPTSATVVFSIASLPYGINNSPLVHLYVWCVAINSKPSLTILTSTCREQGAGEYPMKRDHVKRRKECLLLLKKGCDEGIRKVGNQENIADAIRTHERRGTDVFEVTGERPLWKILHGRWLTGSTPFHDTLASILFDTPPLFPSPLRLVCFPVGRLRRHQHTENPCSAFEPRADRIALEGPLPRIATDKYTSENKNRRRLGKNSII